MQKLTAIALVLAALGCASAQAQSPGFTVGFTWQGTASCFDPQSPPFSLAGVPPGTKQLKFSMKDLEAPNFPHGGGTVAYNGQSQIKQGAFAYQGPCPRSGGHNYRWTVEAVDGAGKTLAVATATRKFPERS